MQIFKSVLVLFLYLYVPSFAQDNQNLSVPSQIVRHKFEIIDIVPGFRQSNPSIAERPTHLVHDAPDFTANATVKCRTPANESWTIGFVQQVDFKNLRLEYANAFLTVELPNLPIADTIGGASPWYNDNSGIGRQEVKGGNADFIVELAMLDAPWHSTFWQEPRPPFGKTYASQRTLQRVLRHQKFTTWLIAMRDSDGYFEVLAKIKWESKVDISVESNKPLGRRSKANPVVIATPQIFINDGQTPKEEMQIPKQVMLPPTANSADQTWWNPKEARFGQRTRLH